MRRSRGSSAALALALVLVALSLTACGLLRRFQRAPEAPVPDHAMGAPAYSLASDARFGLEPRSIAVSPGGELVAVAGTESFIDVFDARTGARRTRLVGHRIPPVGALVFAPDSRVLVSAGGALLTGTDEPSIRFWNVDTGEQVQVIERAETGDIVGLALSGDAGTLLAAASDSLKMWRGRERKSAAGFWNDHTALICGMAASADLGVVATAGRDQRIIVRRQPDMNRFQVFQHQDAAPCGLRMNPEGSLLVSWDAGATLATVYVWDLVRLAPRNRFDIRGRVLDVFFGESPVALIQGSVITLGVPPPASEPPSTRISMISLVDGRTMGTVPVAAGPKFVVSVPGGRTVVTATWDGHVQTFRR